MWIIIVQHLMHWSDTRVYVELSFPSSFNITQISIYTTWNFKALVSQIGQVAGILPNTHTASLNKENNSKKPSNISAATTNLVAGVHGLRHLCITSRQPPNSDSGKRFSSSKTSRLTPAPIKTPIQSISVFFQEGKAAGTWFWPLIPN